MTSISNLTRLNSFTLSCCGSRTPLPTLKPSLTVSVPRLCTGCSLGFTRVGLSPTRITGAELAHHPMFFGLERIRLQLTVQAGFLRKPYTWFCVDTRGPNSLDPWECVRSTPLGVRPTQCPTLSAHPCLAVAGDDVLLVTPVQSKRQSPSQGFKELVPKVTWCLTAYAIISRLRFQTSGP